VRGNFQSVLPHSELNRFLRSSGFVEVSDDLRTALNAAQGWIERSGGAFHPGAEAFSALWREPSETRPPDESSLRVVLEALRVPSWA
jgi:FAD:protein FMN transferase